MPNVLRAMPKEDWQLLERLLRSLRNSDRPGVSGGSGRRSSRGANPRPRTMAKITEVGEEGVYAAEEVIWDTDAGEWIALDGGYQWLIETPTGNPRFVGPLMEQSGSTGAAVDDVVEARLGPTVNTDDSSTDYGWFFGLGGGGGAIMAQLTGPSERSGYLARQVVFVADVGDMVGEQRVGELRQAGPTGLFWGDADQPTLQEMSGIDLDVRHQPIVQVFPVGGSLWMFSSPMPGFPTAGTNFGGLSRTYQTLQYDEDGRLIIGPVRAV